MNAKAKPTSLPDPDQPVYTLSLTEMAALLLRACDLPHAGVDVAQLLQQLARASLAAQSTPPSEKTLRMTSHLRRYL